ncbi:MAG: nucleotide exchange factor GrpE [Bacilli bacterium]|jgi:molecular chaperone GrpE
MTKKKCEEELNKIKELEDKLLRIQAETQNYIRRTEEEKRKIIKSANADLIEQLLPTIDNFERAIKMDDTNLDDELSKFLEGFKLIYSSMISILKEMNLKEIEALDKEFDPRYHNAVLTNCDPNKADNIVLEVLQKGYMLEDKLIRPAMVSVNKL